MASEISETRVDQHARYRREGEAMVAAWEASGLSMRAYAQRAGISERWFFGCSRLMLPRQLGR